MLWLELSWFGHLISHSISSQTFMHSKRLNNVCVDLGQDFKKRPFTALTNTPSIAVKPGKSEGEGENEEANWDNIRQMIEVLVDRTAKDVGDLDLTNKMDQARKALEKALAVLLKFPLESEKSKQGNVWFLKQLCRVLPHDPALHHLPPPAPRHSKEWATLVGWWLVHRMQLCLSQSTQVLTLSLSLLRMIGRCCMARERLCLVFAH